VESESGEKEKKLENQMDKKEKEEELKKK